MSKLRFNPSTCQKCGRTLEVKQVGEDQWESEAYVSIVVQVQQVVPANPHLIGNREKRVQVAPVQAGVLCLSCVGVINDSLGKTGS